MSDRPEILVLSGMPSETPETIDDLIPPIEEAYPDVDIAVAENYADGVEKIPTANAVIAQHPTNEQLDSAEELDWIHGLSAGVDHFPLDRLEDEGIALTSASSANANSVAEHAMSLVLAFERRLNHAIRQQERTEWQLFTAGELRGKTLGLIGVGEIGGRIADLASAFGMDVVGTKRDITEFPDVVDEIHPPEDLHEVLGQSDYVVVCCPLTEETRGMLTIKEFSTSMKRDAVLVNVGRGEIVEERHLAIAVQRGFIRGAGLDVFEEEPLPVDSSIWNTKDIIVTPHAGGATDHFLQRCGELFVENYGHYLEGRLDEFRNRVL